MAGQSNDLETRSGGRGSPGRSSAANDLVGGRDGWATRFGSRPARNASPRDNSADALQVWAARFVERFGLGFPVPRVRLGILPRNSFGHVCNGLLWTVGAGITMNARYLDALPEWEILGELLHQLLHAHQAPQDRYAMMVHDTELREMADKFGLILGRHGGGAGCRASGQFRDLLDEHGIHVPDGQQRPRDLRGDAGSALRRREGSVRTGFVCKWVDLVERCPICDECVCRDIVHSDKGEPLRRAMWGVEERR